MKIFLRFLFLSVFLILFLSLFSLTIKAQNADCADSILNEPNQSKFLIGASSCLDDLIRAKNQSVAATAGVQKQIDGIKARVVFIENDLVVKQKNIDDGYKNLAKLEKILNRAIRDFYIKSYYNSPLLTLLSASSASEITQLLAYQKAATDQNKVIIINIAISIQDLEAKKKNLEVEQANLAVVKDKLDKVVADAKAYQASLSNKIAALSARQQEILGQRLAGLNIPRSAGTGASACVSDIGKDPSFSGAGFAFFTYGVPNRTGLNQYGAWGRAKAGQDHKTILNAYYTNFELKEDYDENIQIHVVDSGIDMTLSIEEYVKRIYEMPGSWVENDRAALKAQAIAARSYALAYTNNGQNSICATEKCQVFKTNPKGGDWDGAAEATRGDVMVQGGSPVKAWYSSTHGGYIFSTSELPGWSDTSWTKHATDTPSGSAGNFGELQSNAYDKDSPWFYCDWGSRANYNKTAWLKPSEIADIANVILLARADSSTKDHFYQTDKPHPYGGEVWNEDRVKSELSIRNIAPFSAASDVSIAEVDFASGRTSRVTISGDGKSESFSGSEFKDWFNLRAPANIQIVGPLYNVEKR